MSPTLAKFVAFAAFSAVSLAAGYITRKRNWASEETSRPIHYFTVVWLWSAAALLSVWNLPANRENLWLLVIMPVIVAAAGFGVIPLAKAIGCTPKQVGAMAIGCGIGNLGFTLGGYLCYVLIEPAEQAIGYAVAAVSIMNMAGVIMLYPVAHYYGGEDEPPTSNARLVLRSLFDMRAMMFYAALVGAILSALHVPYPRLFLRWYLLDILFYLGAFGSYFGIGLRLWLGDSAAFLRQHALIAAVRFLAIPLLMAGMLYLINRSPWPMSPIGTRVLIIESFMPAAIQMVAASNLFHLDTRLASVAWLWNTVLFFVVPLPVILWWMA